MNLSLGEQWTKKELDELMFVNCPRCNDRFEKDVLIATIELSQ